MKFEIIFFSLGIILAIISIILFVLILKIEKKTKNDSLNAKKNLEINIELAKVLDYLKDGILLVKDLRSIFFANSLAKDFFKLFASKNRNYDEIVSEYSEALLSKNVREKLGKYETIKIANRAFLFRYEKLSEEGDVIAIIFGDITEKQKLGKIQSDFALSVSHELKTPIAVIKSYSETLSEAIKLKNKVSNSEASSELELANGSVFLDTIVAETDRMAKLISNLLRITKLDLGDENLKRKKTDVKEVLSVAVSRVNVLAKEKFQKVSMLSKDENYFAYLDEDMLEQVFINILTNSIRYTKNEGRIDIDIFDNEKKIVIIFQDNGIGIPPEFQKKIFERFFRVDKARSKKEGGTGLGLSISKQIIERHGGTIEATSKLDEGTKITINLPKESKSDDVIKNDVEKK